MDSDQKFWLTIISFVLVGFCCLVLSISGVVIHSKYQIAKAIERGASPIEAKFAFRSDSQTDSTVIMGAILDKNRKNVKNATH